MGVNVGDWYTDPAQRYNDVIFPQKDRIRRERETEYPNRKQERGRVGGPEKTDQTPAKELSAAAQKLLDRLKKTYDNVDFSVAGSNNSADARAKLAGGTRKYSVLFTNEELEKMATDEKYQKTMLNRMHEGFQKTATEGAKLGIQAIGHVKSVGMIFDPDGSSSLYREMTDSMDAQRTRIEEQREKRMTQRKMHPDKPQPPKAGPAPYERHTVKKGYDGKRGPHR